MVLLGLEGKSIFWVLFVLRLTNGHRLGHLAIQYAAKLGAEVVVFSGSADKEKEALALGAKEFFVTKDLVENKPGKKLDYLFITANGHPDFNV